LDKETEKNEFVKVFNPNEIGDEYHKMKENGFINFDSKYIPAKFGNEQNK
jgi:hypothetical protein